MGITEKDIIKTVIKVPQLEQQTDKIYGDLLNCQTKTDNDLKTTSKEIVGAINELYDTPSCEIETVEPLDTDIPKVFISGNDFSRLTASKNEVVMNMDYISKTSSFKGKVKIKFQGTSSLQFPKKNFTIKMFSDDNCTVALNRTFKKWGVSTNKYVLKANFIDITHARNIVSARLWGDCVRSREEYASLPIGLTNSPNDGAIDGFGVKLYINGDYQGRYTWNLGKEAYTYGVDKNNVNHCILCGEDYNSGCFREVAKIDGTDWSNELNSTTTPQLKDRWNEIINFVRTSTNQDFKDRLGEFFDVNSLIDYYCFADISCGIDSMGKNQIYTTYDGLKWYACMYDLDSTFGLYYDGTKFVDYKARMQQDYESMVNGRLGNLLYIRLEELFYGEIQVRYSTLRKGALSLSNIMTKFEDFLEIFTRDIITEDGTIYPTIPSQTTNNISQIRSFVKNRLEHLDYKHNCNTEIYDIYLASNERGADVNVWTDLSGNGNHLLLNGFNHDGTDGWVNGGLLFNGNTSYGVANTFKPFSNIIGDFELSIEFTNFDNRTAENYILGLMEEVNPYIGVKIGKLVTDGTGKITNSIDIHLNTAKAHGQTGHPEHKYSYGVGDKNKVVIKCVGRIIYTYINDTLVGSTPSNLDNTQTLVTNQCLYIGGNIINGVVTRFSKVSLSKLTFRKI